MSNIEHSCQLADGYRVRAIARRDGVRIVREISDCQDEIIGTASWKQIEHLRAQVSDQR